MNFTNYIQAELLTLVPMLNIIGYWIKNKTKINNKYIPLILGLIGVVFCTIYTIGLNGIDVSSIMTGIIQGFLVASASVYANQVVKQTKKEEKDDDIE